MAASDQSMMPVSVRELEDVLGAEVGVSDHALTRVADGSHARRRRARWAFEAVEPRAGIGVHGRDEVDDRRRIDRMQVAQEPPEPARAAGRWRSAEQRSAGEPFVAQDTSDVVGEPRLRDRDRHGGRDGLEQARLPPDAAAIADPHHEIADGEGRVVEAMAELDELDVAQVRRVREHGASRTVARCAGHGDDGSHDASMM